MRVCGGSCDGSLWWENIAFEKEGNICRGTGGSLPVQQAPHRADPERHVPHRPVWPERPPSTGLTPVFYL